MKTRRWSEVAPEQRRMIVLAGALEFALTLYTLNDLRQRTDEQVRGARRWWFPAVFVQPFGPIAYLAFGRKPRADT
jgi:hypothetical protein